MRNKLIGVALLLSQYSYAVPYPLARPVPPDCFGWMAEVRRPWQNSYDINNVVLKHYSRFPWPKSSRMPQPAYDLDNLQWWLKEVKAELSKPELEAALQQVSAIGNPNLSEVADIYRALTAGLPAWSPENWELALAAAKFGFTPSVTLEEIERTTQVLTLVSWRTGAWWNEEQNKPRQFGRRAVAVVWNLMANTGLELKNAVELLSCLVVHFPGIENFNRLGEILNSRHPAISPIEAVARMADLSTDPEASSRPLDEAERYVLKLSPKDYKALQADIRYLRIRLNLLPERFLRAYLYAKLVNWEPKPFIELWQEMERRMANSLSPAFTRGQTENTGPEQSKRVASAIIILLTNWRGLEFLLGK